ARGSHEQLDRVVGAGVTGPEPQAVRDPAGRHADGEVGRHQPSLVLRLPAHRPGATVTRPVAPPGRPAPPVPAQGGRPPRALLPGAEGGSGVRARYSRRPPLLGHVPPSRHTSARAPRPPVLPNVPP